MGTVAKSLSIIMSIIGKKILELQHSIIGKIKSIIGWCLEIRNDPAVKSKETRLDDYLQNETHFNAYFWLAS